MIQGTDLADAGKKYLGTPYEKMDCQKFVEKCLEDCGLKIDLAGSNAWYRDCFVNGWVGTPEECVKTFGTTPEGAFLFIHAYDGGEEKRGYHDGLGNASHIGICTGSKGKGAIHSSSSRGCVAESVYKNKTIKGGWNMVGLSDKVAFDYGGGSMPVATDDPAPVKPEPKKTEYKYVYAETGSTVNLREKKNEKTGALVERIPIGEQVECVSDDGTWTKVKWKKYSGYMKSVFLVDAIPESPQDSKGRPILRRGDKGAYVTKAQTQLIMKGYDCGKYGADGSFGAGTEGAVMSFQADHGLKPDGIIGESTWEALDSIEKEEYTIIISHLTKTEAEQLAGIYIDAIVKKEG